MIKTIIFDLGGVLIDLNMQGCFENIRALGVDLDALNTNSGTEDETIGATICEGVTASGLMHLYQVGKVSTEDFLGTILKLSKEGTTYQQVLDAWNSCLLTIPQYKLDFVKQLKSEGYNIYLLSNTNDAHWTYFLENSLPEPVSNYFDKTFLSQEMGLAKPNEEIYKAVLEQIPTPADECLFIDDSKTNCDAAEMLGIHTYKAPVRTDYREDIRRLIAKGETKEELYATLLPQLESLIEGESDEIANMANVSACIKDTFHFWWVGFYRVIGEELVLGPFQGPLACTRIKKGRGVCGTAWEKAETIVVPDVHKFPGHIACSSASKSEIVVPIIKQGTRDGYNKVIAVLDIDSEYLNTFDETDKLWLEKLAQIMGGKITNLK